MYLKKTIWLCLSMALMGSLLMAACVTPPATPEATKEAQGTEAVPTSPPIEQATEPPAAEKTITISFITGDPESLNPLFATTWGAECVFNLIYLPLWNLDKDGNYHMELAEELPTLENGGISADGLNITIKFREEAAWSDGTPVTADDAVFTYDMIMSDANGVFSRYPYDTYVESIKALDPKTLQITLNAPYVDWTTSLFTGISRIIPKHVLEPVFQADGTLDNAEWNRQPTVVNGPYLLDEFVPASHVSFLANDSYWRGRPKLDKVFFRLIEDRAAQLAALASGDSDVGSYIVGSEVPELEKLGNLQFFTAANGYQVLMFLNIDPNTASPAMTDPNVRRALALAIDRQQIIDELYNSLYLIPSTYWEGTVFDDPDLEPYPFVKEQAASLLEAAGWVDSNNDGVREKDGEDLLLRYAYISGDETTDTMIVSIQQMLAEVGIKMDIYPNTQEVLWASYTDNGPLALGEFDMTHWSDGMWYFPAPDTSYFLCSEIPTADYPTGLNWFGVCDEKLEELFAAQASEIDPQKRIEMYHEIGRLMYDNTLIIPLRNDPDVWAVNDRLVNVEFSGIDPFMFIYQWDVK